MLHHRHGSTGRQEHCTGASLGCGSEPCPVPARDPWAIYYVTLARRDIDGPQFLCLSNGDDALPYICIEDSDFRQTGFKSWVTCELSDPGQVYQLLCSSVSSSINGAGVELM